MVFGEVHNSINIIIDFENVVPQSESERNIYETVSAVLVKTPTILEKLNSYKDCGEIIRKAITKPTPEIEEEAWREVLPSVEQMKEFYDFSLELDSCFPKLLSSLCHTDPKQNIINQQALAKEMADVFNFVLRFDDLKMANPGLQNDFSYYRRTLNRKKITKSDANVTIKDELANRMSLFFAYPTPMLNVVNESMAKFLGQNPLFTRENVTTTLAIMANICQEMVTQKKFLQENTNMYCLRAMTGAIIIFDRFHLVGAFSKKSPINIKACIGVLKNYTEASTFGLLNALRFTTCHLNDPETPAAIRQLLDL